MWVPTVVSGVRVPEGAGQQESETAEVTDVLRARLAILTIVGVVSMHNGSDAVLRTCNAGVSSGQRRPKVNANEVCTKNG